MSVSETRFERLDFLMKDSRRIVSEAIQEHVVEAKKSLIGVVVLFSGGNDSTVLAHMFRDLATHAAHANTQVGIEETREFVRRTCREWNLPLIEQTPPMARDQYKQLILANGFPGPAHHYKMYQCLKQRSLRVIKNQLVTYGSQRVIFLAGRRRTESDRRTNIPEYERDGSIIWVSPLVNWDKLDLNSYRIRQGDVPVNRVSELIHMSGECLCGSFAKLGEREEITDWFPNAFNEIAELEAAIQDNKDISEERRRWGWGAYRGKEYPLPKKTGMLCSSCSIITDWE